MKFISIGDIYINAERVNRVFKEDVKGTPQPFCIVVRCAENDAFRMAYDNTQARDDTFQRLRDVFQVME